MGRHHHEQQTDVQRHGAHTSAVCMLVGADANLIHGRKNAIAAPGRIAKEREEVTGRG